MRVALTVKPDQVTLVPERREELTTEGGLDVVLNSVQIRPVVRTLQEAGIEVSLFVDPELEQVKEAHKLDARAVEINTAAWSEAADGRAREAALREVTDAARLARKLGLARPRRPRPRLRQRGRGRGADRDHRAQHRPRDRGPRGARGHGAGGARDDRGHALAARGKVFDPAGKPPMLGRLR